MERAIHISSINREKTGENRPDNFLIKFNPPLKLDPIKKHSLAIDRLTMTYSWYNIRSSYNNNTIKYSNDRGANWNTITFKDGMYSYTDINDYLHQYMEKQHRQLFRSWRASSHSAVCRGIIRFQNGGPFHHRK